MEKILNKIMYLLYKYCKFLLPLYIKEQIEFRINYMNRFCYYRGKCISCNTNVNILQTAVKSCNYSCFPSIMFSKYEWNLFKDGGYAFLDIDKDTYFSYKLSKDSKDNKILIREQFFKGNKIEKGITYYYYEKRC